MHAMRSRCWRPCRTARTCPSAATARTSVALSPLDPAAASRGQWSRGGVIAPVRVLSVNVGLPREVASGEKNVLTSIFKSPVDGRVSVRGHNLAGDQQSDLRVHGGVFKAVYAYPSEHYAFWKHELP